MRIPRAVLINACALLVTLAPAAPAPAPQSSIARAERTPSGSQIEDLYAGLGAGHPSGARAMKSLAPELMTYFEGWEPRPYDDPSGFCTIGYGHLIRKARCADTDISKFPHEMSVVDALALFEADTLTARAAVQKLVTIDLADHEFGALVSFTYNVGKTNFAKSRLLGLVNQGDKAAAAKAFNDYVASNGKILNGLIDRRSCESALFKQDLHGKDGQFTVSECRNLGAAPSSGAIIDIVTGETLLNSRSDQ
jgi:lysozyme